MVSKEHQSNNGPPALPVTPTAAAAASRGDGADSQPPPELAWQQDEPQRALALPAPAARDNGTRVCSLRTLIVDVEELRNEVAVIAETLSRVADRSAALEHLADQNRSLTERFHEREVLGVVFQTLIALLDRSRDAQTHLKQQRRSAGANGHVRRFSRLSNMIEDKGADCLIIEQMLAQLGVEPFIEPSDSFNPSTQTCLQNVPTTDPEQHGEVARRWSVGYRRGDVIIRREKVSVFVSDHDGSHSSKENKPCQNSESTTGTLEAKPVAMTRPADSLPS